MEPPRQGEDPSTCLACTAPDDAYIWISDRWRVRATETPTGLPMVLILESRSHLDLGDLPNLLAAELGVMTVRLERAIRSLDEVAQVHVNRWGDGSAHLHLWFLGRPAGRLQLRGPFLAMWDEILEPVPEAEWRVNLAHIAAWLEEFGGRALIEPPRIVWHAPSTFAGGAAMQASEAAAAKAAADGAAADGAAADGTDTAGQPESGPASATPVASEAANTGEAADAAATADPPESEGSPDGAATPVTADGAAPARVPTARPATTGGTGRETAAASATETAAADSEIESADTDANAAGRVVATAEAASTDDALEDGAETGSDDGDVAGPTVRIPAQATRARVARAPSGRFVASREHAERVADDDPDYDLASDSR